MKHLFIVFMYLVSLAHTLLRQGGMKVVVAENLLLKQQLLVLTRSRKRARMVKKLKTSVSRELTSQA